MIDPAALAVGLLGGLALGALTGLPLGVMNVAVVTTAATDGVGPAARLGAGGAAADATHALVAFTGLGPALLARPRATAIASGVAGVLCLAVALLLVLRRATAPTAPSTTRRGRGRFWLGVALTLPNPAALTAWLTVAAAVGPLAAPVAAVTAVGVGLGSAAYFAGLARLAARAGRAPPPKVLDRIAALALAGLGAVALARAFT
ncbi:MAG: LysE family transporter [Kofleriaceae bacterium]|nr:LysE family transporter [Kofleriaceae bacterium]MBP9172384.1 LysE family transporter [Kofleriaceae bacterium]MBP9862992.1 LysE family transporter [Kofleriaceae bacterium]